jgi:hypothetical protein
MPKVDRLFSLLPNKWWGTLSWAVCTTNIDWKKWRHEKGENPER